MKSPPKDTVLETCKFLDSTQTLKRPGTSSVLRIVSGLPKAQPEGLGYTQNVKVASELD